MRTRGFFLTLRSISNTGFLLAFVDPDLDRRMLEGALPQGLLDGESGGAMSFGPWGSAVQDEVT